MAINNPRPGGQSGFITPTGAETMSNKVLGDNSKYDFQDVTIASNTFARPVGTAARITSGAGPLNTITGGNDGNFLILENKSGAVVTLANDNGANGFLTGTGVDLDLEDDASITLLYNSSDGRWSIIGGSGSGTGSGGLNYVTNSDAEANVTDGITATNVTVSAETVSPLVGDQSFKLAFGAAATGSVDWSLNTIDSAYENGASLSVQAICKMDAYTDGAYVIGVHDGTSYVTIQTTLPTNTSEVFHYKDMFFPESGKTYTVRISGSGITTGANLLVDRVSVGPDQLFSAPIVYTESWTPTFNTSNSDASLGNGSVFGTYQRIGEWMYGRVDIRAGSTTVDGTGQYTFTLPSGLNMTSDDGFRGDTGDFLGHGFTVSGDSDVEVLRYTSNSITLYNMDTTTVVSSTNSPFTSGKYMNLFFKTKIAEWAGSTTNYINETNIGSNARIAGYIDTVGYSSISGNGDVIDYEFLNNEGFTYDNTTGAVTIPATGFYQLTMATTVSLGTATYMTGVMRLNSSTGTDILRTIQGGESVTRTVYLTAGDEVFVVAYTDGTGSAGFNQWRDHFAITRIANVSAGQAFGFGLATADRAGLQTLPNGQIRLHTTLGNGSVDTAIRYFSTSIETGDAFTLTTNDSTNGVQITVNRDCIAHASYWDRSTGGSTFGISLNSTQLTQTIFLINAADRICATQNPANTVANASATVRLSAGDIIRPHGDGLLNYNNAVCGMIITEVTRL